MKKSAIFSEWTKDRIEEIGRARVWAVLRNIDSEFLKEAGIEPELLELGPNAWPWRAADEETWPNNDGLIARTPIDERGAPVPFESKARLDGSDLPKSPYPSERGLRDLAA